MSLVERAPDELSARISLGSLLTNQNTRITGESRFGLHDYVDEIIGSGFPAIRRLSLHPRTLQIDSYIDRIIDSDFQDQGFTVRRPATLRRWMEAYAAATATPSAYEAIRDAATPGINEKPARTTTQPYRDMLERLWLLDEVPAWIPSRNLFSRLAQAPKHHLADPALAARLLGLAADALLQGAEGSRHIVRNGTLLGHLFESLVTQSLKTYAQAVDAHVRHLRLHGGRREVDLIVERPDGRVLAIEVKLARTPTDSDVRNLLWLRDQLGDRLVDAAIVTSGPFAYRRDDGVAVIPAALLGP